MAFVAPLGGFGSFIGAAVGGFLMGLIEGLLGGQYLNVNYGNILILAVLVAVLLLRPHGIFGGTATRRLV